MQAVYYLNNTASVQSLFNAHFICLHIYHLQTTDGYYNRLSLSESSA